MMVGVIDGSERLTLCQESELAQRRVPHGPARPTSEMGHGREPAWTGSLALAAASVRPLEGKIGQSCMAALVGDAAALDDPRAGMLSCRVRDRTLTQERFGASPTQWEAR